MPTLLSDLEIAHAAKLEPITDVAHGLGLEDYELELYGRYKAKIDLSVLERLKTRPSGKMISVTAINPTPLGEGKTVTAIGLGQALGRSGHKVCNTCRQPSLGPTFGIKGGAAGGGYSQVVPMEDMNLHLTGDFHAVTAAQNLCAAMIDASLLHGNPLRLDPLNITWRRCLDTNDRALRDIVLGLGGKANGVPRETGFDITAASETMAILALANSLADLRQRLGRIVVGFTTDGKPVTGEDLKAAGAMTVLLRDALKPNLMQTLEHTPVLVHCGPFGNVAHGNNSVLADRIALRLADYVITESGFGADMGFEKLVNITCRQSGLEVATAVVVCTVRALKMHGGVGKIVAGKPLPPELTQENFPALEKGLEILGAALHIVRAMGVPAVVAVNRFETDTDKELAFVVEQAQQRFGVTAVVSDVFARGGEGGRELAEAVVAATRQPSKMCLLYPDDLPVKEKIERLATRLYGADGVEYAPEANRKIKLYTDLGFGRLPICMAKTHLSLSHDPNWKGVPRDYKFAIRDVRLSAGAGFLYPIAGEMQTMPGLGSQPAAVRIDVNERGEVVGLF
ncbi:MAG: formate--tetrahydrofolate ligase [Acidobacteria bacterium RIFCSPHIGHO2_12_FULL_67_30]|nr:MAG: formate--tetrahydrofolate ligase [Acidobacteria bacterium RIFCSPHIGHO2_02_FULL_67_57]OFV84591.1 MAG: formate--tetrahydrofolate ligase [Acidobacteria bacterium RIFCSPHIGHO2_01_FULL_67_28]OFV87904.1 MAG: formate--tetrahydrofolate ligase [Acidobacteria bacterium RIFCSPHIGHO2_12_FULL_67_30]